MRLVEASNSFSCSVVPICNKVSNFSKIFVSDFQCVSNDIKWVWSELSVHDSPRPCSLTTSVSVCKLPSEKVPVSMISSLVQVIYPLSWNKPLIIKGDIWLAACSVSKNRSKEKTSVAWPVILLPFIKVILIYADQASSSLWFYKKVLNVNFCNNSDSIIIRRSTHFYVCIPRCDGVESIVIAIVNKWAIPIRSWSPVICSKSSKI